MNTEPFNNKNINQYLKLLFLIFLAICGGFMSQMLGCKTQLLLTENMWAKHFILLFVLYFSMGLVYKEISPKETAFATMIVYIGFLVFTKMNLKVTIITFILLAIHYIMGTYIEYYSKSIHENKKTIDNLKKIQNGLITFIIVIILFGFISYTKEKYSEYKKDWSTSKFLFGTLKCKSIQNRK